MVTLHNNNYRQSNICSASDYPLDLSTGKQKLSTGQIINSYPQSYPHCGQNCGQFTTRSGVSPTQTFRTDVRTITLGRDYPLCPICLSCPKMVQLVH